MDKFLDHKQIIGQEIKRDSDQDMDLETDEKVEQNNDEISEDEDDLKIIVHDIKLKKNSVMDLALIEPEICGTDPCQWLTKDVECIKNYVYSFHDWERTKDGFEFYMTDKEHSEVEYFSDNNTPLLFMEVWTKSEGIHNENKDRVTSVWKQLVIQSINFEGIAKSLFGVL